MKALLLLAVIAAGSFSSIQASANAALGKAIGPFPAALVSLALSASILAMAGAGLGQLHWPGHDRLHGTAWWMWVGGLLGSTIMASQLFVVPKLGSAVFMSIMVTMSVVTSLAIDHFGLLGAEQHAANWGRIAGAVLMTLGVTAIALN